MLTPLSAHFRQEEHIVSEKRKAVRRVSQGEMQSFVYSGYSRADRPPNPEDRQVHPCLCAFMGQSLRFILTRVLRKR